MDVVIDRPQFVILQFPNTHFAYLTPSTLPQSTCIILFLRSCSSPSWRNILFYLPAPIRFW